MSMDPKRLTDEDRALWGHHLDLIGRMIDLLCDMDEVDFQVCTYPIITELGRFAPHQISESESTWVFIPRTEV